MPQGSLTPFNAFTIPNVLRRFVAEGALTVALFGLYRYKREERPRRGRQFFGTLGLVLVCVSLLALLGIIFAPAFVYAFASGFAGNEEQFALTVSDDGCFFLIFFSSA